MGHQSDGSSDAIAVQLEVVKARIARPGQIHPLTLNHVEVGLDVLGKALEGVHHHSIEIILDRSVEQGASFFLPAIQAFRQFINGACLSLRAVHQLIGATAPDVDGPDGTALLLGQQKRPQVKGLGPLSGLTTASLKGCVEIRGCEGHHSGRNRLADWGR